MKTKSPALTGRILNHVMRRERERVEERESKHGSRIFWISVADIKYLFADFVSRAMPQVWDPLCRGHRIWGPRLSTIFTLSWLLFTHVTSPCRLTFELKSSFYFRLVSEVGRTYPLPVVPHQRRRFDTSSSSCSFLITIVINPWLIDECFGLTLPRSAGRSIESVCFFLLLFLFSPSFPRN